jgi:hypothetical protein
MACRTCPQSGWPPTSARLLSPDTPWTRLRRSVPPADTRAVAGRPTDMADLLTVRSAGHPQFEVTAQPMGPGPGPDGDGQAADTSSAQRPTMRLAAGHGQPRGLHVLALTGQDGNAHARLRPTQPLPASGPARQDHLHPCSMPNVRKPGPRPMSTRSRPASTMDATIGQPSGHRMPRRIRPDTIPSTRHAMANQKRCGQGNGRTARKALGDPRSTQPRRRPAGTRRAPAVGPAFAA